MAHLLQCSYCGVALGRSETEPAVVCSAKARTLCGAELRDDVAYIRPTRAERRVLMQSVALGHSEAFKYLAYAIMGPADLQLHYLEHAARVAPGEILVWFYRARASASRGFDVATSYAVERVQLLGTRGLEDSLRYWLIAYPNNLAGWTALAEPIVEVLPGKPTLPTRRRSGYSTGRLAALLLIGISIAWIVVEPARRNANKIALIVLGLLAVALVLRAPKQ